MEVLRVSPDGSAFLLKDADENVRVFDRATGRLSPPVALENLLAHGSWEPYVGDQHHVLDLIAHRSRKTRPSKDANP
jgi:hypothetical protein